MIKIWADTARLCLLPAFFRTPHSPFPRPLPLNKKPVPLIVEITNPQRLICFDSRPLRKIARKILREGSIRNGSLSLAVVDDATIAALHGQYLNDPTPTDVLSFVLESYPGYLEGEVVASAETAARSACEHGW